MPHIKVVDGVMYEFEGVNQRGPIAELGLNAYNYLERRYWSATSANGTDPVEDPDYTIDFPFLAEKGFRFLTVMAAPFGETDWKNVVGQANPDAPDLGIKSTYFPIVRAMLDAAATAGIGIILCPCWNFTAIPGQVSETNTSMLVASSKTRRYLKGFVGRMVAEFHDHPGVAAWMIAQESFNIDAFQPPLARYEDLGAMLQELAQAARDNDSLDRMIHACNNGMLPADTDRKLLDYYVEHVLPAINPAPIDCISETLFFVNEYVSSASYYRVTPSSPQLPNPFRMPDYVSQSLGYLRVLQARAKQLGKPYYVASFGVSTQQETDLGDHSQKDLLTFIDYMARTGVQLASHWVWNSGDIVPEWKILVTSQAPSTYVRPEVFNALRAGQILMQTWPELPITRRGATPAFSTYAKFTVSATQGTMFRASGAGIGAADFSLSYTIRNIHTTALQYVAFFQTHVNDTAGWTVAYNAGSYLQLWKMPGNSPYKSLAGTQAPIDVEGEWTRITWTVRHDGVISLYVNDFLWACGHDAISPSFAGGPSVLSIGRSAQPTAPGQTAEWDLSDVVLYDRELTPKEVFEYGQYGVVRDPVGRWKLDGNMLDSSGNGYNGQQVQSINPPVFTSA